MSRSETEQCVIFLRSLARALDPVDNNLPEYLAEFLSSDSERIAGMQQLRRAADAVELLYKLLEWMRVEM